MFFKCFGCFLGFFWCFLGVLDVFQAFRMFSVFLGVDWVFLKFNRVFFGAIYPSPKCGKNCAKSRDSFDKNP